MKISIATNFEKGFIDKVKDFPVYEIFGALSSSFLNNVLPAPFLPIVDENTLIKTIKKAHNHGIEFNYILNASCLGNIEFKKGGMEKIISFIKWLSEINVDIITVSIPRIIDIIKKNFPELKVKVSLASFVQTLQRARFYRKMGVDAITVDIDQNRNFKLLRLLRKEFNLEISLLINNCCIWGCPYTYYHYASNSHTLPNQGYYNNYCDFNCQLIRTKSPVEMIKARWIRPEDLSYYESIGIEHFKIGGRTKPTNYLIRTLEAYSNRKYDGNLVEILNTQEQTRITNSYSKFFKKVYAVSQKVIEKVPNPLLKKLLQIYSLLPKVPSGNMTKMLTKMPEPYIKALLNIFLNSFMPYIDNKKLDGFLEFFEKVNCNITDCDKCGHCKEYADKAISFPEEDRRKIIDNIEKILDIINIIKN